MKILIIGMALCCSIVVGIGCVAETMGVAAGPMPPMLVVDRVLAVAGFACCIIAMRRITFATIVMWLCVLTYVILSWHFEHWAELTRGVLKWDVATASLLSIGFYLQKKSTIY